MSKPELQITVTLGQTVWMSIVHSLAKRPFGDVEHLIAAIRTQAYPQIEAAQRQSAAAPEQPGGRLS